MICRLTQFTIFVWLVISVVGGVPDSHKIHNNQRQQIQYSLILPETIGYIEQKVDHFSVDIPNEPFYQRFLRNDEFFKPGAPIFLLISMPDTIHPGELSYGRVYELAKEFNGLLVSLEQRYYGESRPSYDANFSHFTIDQILADLAHFIVELKKESGKEKSPVIVVGSKYSGSLAVWFRKRYPELTVGAWASSAPLLAKVDFPDYVEQISANFREQGEHQCYSNVENAIKEAEQLVNEQRFDEFVKTLGFCPSFNATNTQNVAEAFRIIAEKWFRAITLNRMLDIECAFLEGFRKPTRTDAEALGLWLQFRLPPPDKCLSIDYVSKVKSLRQTSWNDEQVRLNKRQWAYQACTQFGWYHSSGASDQPFGTKFPVQSFYQFCEDVFYLSQIEIDRNINETNLKFGGLEPNVTNVFFTQGTRDPYRLLGIQNTTAFRSEAYVINDAGAGQDLYRSSTQDSVEMSYAKMRIVHLIKQWIE